MKRVLKTGLCLITVLATTVSMLSFNTFAYSTSEQTVSNQTVQNSQSYKQDANKREYNNFIKDIEKFNKYEKSQESNKGALSDDEFQLKCATEYYNQKVKNGELPGFSLINSTQKYDQKATFGQVKSIGYKDKYTVRASLWVAAVAMGKDLPRASFFLQHSLSDNPSDVYLNMDDPIVPEIKNTAAYAGAIYTYKHNKSLSYYRSSVIFNWYNSSVDLFLALHETTMYSYSSINYTYRSNVASYIKDIYDFDHKEYNVSNGVVSAAATIIGNYGADAQSIGAVVPYNISIAIPDNR